MKKTRRISRSPFRRRTRRSRMRGGVSTAWQRLKRSKREKPKIVEKYLGYLAENSPKAKDYLEQFPWLETGNSQEVNSNNTSKYIPSDDVEQKKIKECTRYSVKLLLGDASNSIFDTSFNYCYTNPKRCDNVRVGNSPFDWGSRIREDKNRCRSKIAKYTPEYQKEVNSYWSRPDHNGSPPRHGETGKSPDNGSYLRENNVNNPEYLRREEERKRLYSITGWERLQV